MNKRIGLWIENVGSNNDRDSSGRVWVNFNRLHSREKDSIGSWRNGKKRDDMRIIPQNGVMFWQEQKIKALNEIDSQDDWACKSFCDQEGKGKNSFGKPREGKIEYCHKVQFDRSIRRCHKAWYLIKG